MPKGRTYALFTALLAFFFVSGASGLVYQVVWTRKLALLFGTTAYAVSTVLCIFFLGLGIGGILGGRLAQSTRKPLALYGVFEVIVGLWAALFILGIDAGEGAVAALLEGTAGGRPLGILLRALLSTFFLIVPVTLMGATLPLLTAVAKPSAKRTGWGVGALYTINTLGAVAGTLLAGFYLVPAWGYTRATFAAAAANILVGLLSLLLSARVGPAPPPVETTRGADQDSAAALPPPRTWLIALIAAVLFLEGVATLGSEVLWTRLLSVVFVGTTYAYTTMLASILLGIALGGGLGALLADRLPRPTRILGVLEILAGAACLFALREFAELPAAYENLAKSGGYDWANLLRAKFWAGLGVLFWPTFLLGLTFPFAIRAVAGSGRTPSRVGWLYGANTIGGVAGALAGGFVLLPLLTAHDGLIVLAGCVFVGGALLLTAGEGRRPIPVVRIAATGLVSLIVFAAIAPTGFFSQDNVGEVLTGSRFPDNNALLHYREGVEGIVAVSEETNQTSHSSRVLWINGVQATASIEKGVAMNRFQGALPLLFERCPQSALLIGLGSGITAGTLGAADFDLTAVEISPEVVEAARFFARDNLDVVAQPNVAIRIDDGRNFLLTTQRHFGLITFEPMPLALAGVSAFYTSEYYALCREHLAPGGIVSQWVPLHSLNPKIVRSLVRTFIAAFPHQAAFFINADLFLLSAAEPLRFDPIAAAERLQAPGLHDALVEAGLADSIEMIGSFVMDEAALAEFAGEGPLMSDDRPWAEFEAPKLIHAQQVPASLELLAAHLTSPIEHVAWDRVPESERGPIREALARRFAAKKKALAGLKTYYAGTFGSKPEKEFLEAFDIDPRDRAARYYLRQIAEHRVELYLDWNQADEAVALLETLDPALEDAPLRDLLWGDVYAAQGKDLDAFAAYRRFLDAGGAAPRAAEYVRRIEGPTRAIYEQQMTPEENAS